MTERLPPGMIIGVEAGGRDALKNEPPLRVRMWISHAWMRYGLVWLALSAGFVALDQALGVPSRHRPGFLEFAIIGSVAGVGASYWAEREYWQLARVERWRLWRVMTTAVPTGDPQLDRFAWRRLAEADTQASPVGWVAAGVIYALLLIAPIVASFRAGAWWLFALVPVVVVLVLSLTAIPSIRARHERLVTLEAAMDLAAPTRTHADRDATPDASWDEDVRDFLTMTHPVTGRQFRLGTQKDIDWITEATEVTREIISAIPPIFPAYATVVIPIGESERGRHDRRVIELLATASGDQPWWLGYLDTGRDDVILPDAPRVRALSPYVLLQGTAADALGLRSADSPLDRTLPDLVFPDDRSWLLNTLWDDDWRCLGGSAELIESFLSQTDVETRRVRLGEDATPPGHQAL